MAESMSATVTGKDGAIMRGGVRSGNRYAVLFSVLLLTVITGCGGSRYTRKPSPVEIKSIVSVRPVIMHKKTAGSDMPGILRENSPGYGTNGAILDAPVYWSSSKYYSELRMAGYRVDRAIQSGFARDDETGKLFVEALREELDRGSLHVRVMDAKFAPWESRNNEGSIFNESYDGTHVLRLFIWHRVKITGTMIPERTSYAGAAVRIHDLKGNLIYERGFFSDNWFADEEFNPEEFRECVLQFVSETGKQVGIDLCK